MDVLLTPSSRCCFRSPRQSLLPPLRHALAITTSSHPPRHPRRSIRRSHHHSLHPELPLSTPPRPHRHPIPLPTSHLYHPHHRPDLPKVNLHLSRRPPSDRHNRLEGRTAQSSPGLDRQQPQRQTQLKPPSQPRPLGHNRLHGPRPPRSSRHRQPLLHLPCGKRDLHRPSIQHTRLLRLLPPPTPLLPLHILHLQPPDPQRIHIRNLLSPQNIPLPPNRQKGLRNLQTPLQVPPSHPHLVPPHHLGRPPLPPVHGPNHDPDPVAWQSRQRRPHKQGRG